MGKQRNGPHKKEQENSPGEEINEMKTSNLSDIEFKVRMLNSMKNNIEMITKRTSQK